MDEPWKKKKEKKFGDFFFDFGKIENMMDKMMKDMFREEDLEGLDKKPLVYGFSMNIDSEGKPKIEEFGNLKPKGTENIEVASAREPLVDTTQSNNEFVVTAELPGAEKKDICLKCEKGRMAITVNSPERNFFKELALPMEVLPKTAKAKFKNGILEVKFGKEAPGESKGNITID